MGLMIKAAENRKRRTEATGDGLERQRLRQTPAGSPTLDAWGEYAQVPLLSNEFIFVD
jgi:hypothetical protein